MSGRGFLSMVGVVAMYALGSAAPAWAGGGGGQHAGIAITSDASFQSCKCVTSGSGTATNPYVIGPWAITSPAQGSAVSVDNSGGTITAHFTITGVSANYNDPSPSDPVIHLVDIGTATTVSNVSANGDGIGIELDGSSNIALDNISVNKMVGAGLVIDHSSNVSVSNGKWKATADGELPHNEDGLYAVNSSGLRIGTRLPAERAL